MIQMSMREKDEFDVARFSANLGDSLENPVLAPRHTRIDQDKTVRCLDQVRIRPLRGDPEDSLSYLVQMLAPSIGHGQSNPTAKMHSQQH